MASKVDYQSGKKHGLQLKNQESELDSIAAEFAGELDEATLSKYKTQFMSYDINNSGDIDHYELQLLMEKINQPKTYLELKKMIEQVDSTGKGAINFRDFIKMMTGKTSSILQKILMFEEMGKKSEQPKGIPQKRSISDLP
ncbi:calcium-binding protein [Dictyostelium discoideum AX4]|uniref:Calcium-binding protein B n=1 Tax=Dictyostelium discoideum TaxID=44689 RepID=CBPB_DICDI|nr:calcium-binding protein [Dictyostelium discoideum AX4]Q54QX0.1 RecName: Full=Calcium-binding protein B [Dictyostelium discoideum]EAL65644.1 calcium-binding protein [Dictyostelium discoideum AX4]|eukprot:XP_639014.1 calcium-binding protein [Dictyostelium discoideum AX4]